MSWSIATPLVCFLTSGVLWAQEPFTRVSQDEARRLVGDNVNYDTSASMWIWADKILYEPGQPLTVRITLKANGDPMPYTIVAYRLNNQTGLRIFLPSGSVQPSDIFGNGVDNFQAVRLGNLTKQVVVGTGGLLLQQALPVPEEYGMHTLVVELRDYLGGRVIKAAYFKFGVVRGMRDLPQEIASDLTLSNEYGWRINGVVQVRNRATLTIEPGTILIGMPGSQPPSVLLVTTSGKLVAEGTRARPIIMTSSQPIGQRQRGDWGGLIMLGKAQVNDPGGQLNIEGLPDTPDTLYGGNDENHNCGSLRYVRVEFAGALLRPNEETNSFTWGACGKATKGEYLQSHYGLDDAFEWFGGNNDVKYMVGTYAADDYIDFQIGYRGRLQHALLLANADLSNRGIEGDNYERDFGAKPCSSPTIFNMTFVGNNTRGFDETDAPAIYLRRGACGSFNNLLAYNWSTGGIGLGNADTIAANIQARTLSMNGILLWGNGRHANRPDTVAGQTVSALAPFIDNSSVDVRSILVADPKLRRPLEYSDPDLRPLPGSAVFAPRWIQPPDDGFFDQWAHWIGGIGPVNWTEEWATFVQEEDMRP